MRKIAILANAFRYGYPTDETMQEDAEAILEEHDRARVYEMGRAVLGSMFKRDLAAILASRTPRDKYEQAIEEAVERFLKPPKRR